MKLKTTYYRVTQDTDANCRAIAEGVKGVQCVAVDNTRVLYTSGALHAQQKDIIDVLVETMPLDSERHLGTCEVYANRAMNIYDKAGSRVVGVFLIRPIQQDT